jgi:hypothetical protein
MRIFSGGPVWLGPVLALGLVAGCTTTDSKPPPLAKAARLNTRAMAFHERRCLNDASELYGTILKLDPPAGPSDAQWAAVLRHAPRLYTTASEFFPLKDVVAVVHPVEPVIAYHLFWEDDIDFPDDNDPCDHEIVWVRYDPVDQRVVKVYTYFHEQILEPPEAVADANAHQGRPWIGVEWGKHGSLPWDAAGLQSGVPNALFHEDWEALHHSIRLPDHPLARGWPRSFPGTFADYCQFQVLVDPTAMLQQKKLVEVSRWGMASINQRCLRYNFAPKPDWPWTQ